LIREHGQQEQPKQPWKRNNEALKWFRWKDEQPPGVPVTGIIRIDLSEPFVMIGVCDHEPKGEGFSFTSPAVAGRQQPWSWKQFVRVLSCMLEVGLDVFVVAAFLVPQLDALGVSCRLVSRSSNCRCGIFVLGMHGDIKGLARDLPAPGMGRHSGPLRSVFDKALPKARVKSVARGEFLGLWFADVARRSAAAVESRAASAEWRALQAGSKAGKKRSRDVDAFDL